MNRDNLRYVRECVESEGFWEAMVHYSDYPEIKDQRFHELRKRLLDAANELGEYLLVDYENS